MEEKRSELAKLSGVQRSLANLKRYEKGKRVPNPKTGGLLVRPKQGESKMSIVACLKQLMTQDVEIPEHLRILLGDEARNGKARMEVVVACQLAHRAVTVGDIKSLRELMDRVEGKSVQRTEVTGKDGTPLDFATGAAELIRSRLLQDASIGEAPATT